MSRERIAELPDNDLRRQKPEFQDPQLTPNLELVERLQQVGNKYGHSTAETAVAWTLHNPAVDGAIVGLRGAEQVDGIVGALEIELTSEDLTFLGASQITAASPRTDLP